MNVERAKRTIEIWDRCECERTLHSIAEGERGTCATCWYKSMPSDTRLAMSRLFTAPFKPTLDDEIGRIIDDAMAKIERDMGVAS